MNVKDIRRENLRLIAQDVGGIAEIARRLNKSTSQISHLIGPNPIKNIGDRIAAEVENIFNKPSGWLDQPQVGNDHILSQSITHHIPLLSWEQAAQWPEQEASAHPSIPVSNHIASADAFALPIMNDLMESDHGISFPANSQIIVDVQQEAQPNDFILVKSSRHNQLLFRQWIVDADRQYLKPLNQRYPIMALPNDAQIIGVIVQVQIDIKVTTS